MIFVDTNYFLRFLLEEKTEQQKIAVDLFQKASLGKVKLFTSTIVIFEIYWVMSSFYQKNKKEIKNIISDILKMGFIEIKERELLLKAVEFLDLSGYDFEDVYNLVYAKNNGAEDIATFDKTLEKKFIEINLH